MIASVISRFLGYGVGFISTLLLARTFGQEDFGQYSKIQSALEFSSIVMGFGYSLNLYRESFRTRENVINFKAVMQVILYSMPFGLLIGWIALREFSVAVDWSLSIILILSVLFSSLLNQLLAVQKGIGNILYPSSEYAVRSVAFLVVFFGTGAYFGYTVFVGVMSSVVSLGLVLLFIFVHSKTQVEFGKGIQVSNDLSVIRTFYSVITFLLKKGDLIIFGVLLSNEAYAQFKIAFLFSEAVYQFAQIGAIKFLDKCRSSIEFMNLKYRGLGHVQFNIVSSVILTIASASVGVLVDYLRVIEYDYLEPLFWLLFYFSAKSFVATYEQLYMLQSKEWSLLKYSICDLFVKLSLVYVFYVYTDNLYSVYFVLGVYELIAWIMRFKKIPEWSLV